MEDQRQPSRLLNIVSTCGLFIFYAGVSVLGLQVRVEEVWPLSLLISRGVRMCSWPAYAFMVSKLKSRALLALFKCIIVGFALSFPSS